MYKLYYHGGSANHGCEAIVRTTLKILDAEAVLYTSGINEDKRYGLDEIVSLEPDEERRLDPRSFENLFAAVMHKLRDDDFYYTTQSHRTFFNQVKEGDVYFSIGGDNYCYKGRDILGYYNKRLHQKGAKTVLWGCSFDPKDMTSEIAKDLALYDLIVSRETISYEALKAVNPRTVLFCDPAFQLEAEVKSLPSGFVPNNTVGINFSALSQSYGDSDLVSANCRNLLKFLLESTDYSVALIPHVVKPGNDDRDILRELEAEFGGGARIALIPDGNCMQLKGYISQCRFFVGARTHATIAAYSSCVPTLVLGYSVKAKGIAQDLFGSNEHYVQPVQSLRSPTDLVDGFRWLESHEGEIRAHLKNVMPTYSRSILEARKLVEAL